jgi:hypothetical protein
MRLAAKSAKEGFMLVGFCNRITGPHTERHRSSGIYRKVRFA